MTRGWPFERLIKLSKAPSVPQGKTVYAIGDIHGRADLLQPLLEAIRKDGGNNDHAKTVISLGDYVDRGQGSREVIELMLHASTWPDLETVLLRGNHDQLMLDFVEGRSDGRIWLTWGGDATFASYGVDAPTVLESDEEVEALREALKARLPYTHLDFLRRLSPYHVEGDYFFSHAGARPGTALAAQTLYDLMWIRDAFLDAQKPFEKMVVHGHTPSDQVQTTNVRIGIDTGAYASGVLTSLKLEGADRSLLQARGIKGGAVIEIAPIS